LIPVQKCVDDEVLVVVVLLLLLLVEAEFLRLLNDVHLEEKWPGGFSRWR
jgi:hypothetical protein